MGPTHLLAQVLADLDSLVARVRKLLGERLLPEAEPAAHVQHAPYRQFHLPDVGAHEAGQSREATNLPDGTAHLHGIAVQFVLEVLCDPRIDDRVHCASPFGSDRHGVPLPARDDELQRLSC